MIVAVDAEQVEKRVAELAEAAPAALERWIHFYRYSRNAPYDEDTRLEIADRLADIAWLETRAAAEGPEGMG